MNENVIVRLRYLWFNAVYMSGEQITKDLVEIQNLEGGLHTLRDPSTKTKKRVDINDLLNKVRLAQKKEKMESIIFFGLVAAAIIVTGIVVSI